MEWIQNNIWFLVFFIWGLPLGYYRSRFRKLVYQTDNWLINIKPVFTRELRALFGNIYPGNETYLKERKFYRIYLIIYLLLFISYMTFS
jgi:thioredoxin-dependent peroxiredoxin